MGVFIFWLIMAGVVAIIAHAKGRGALGWFLYGFVIWPIALVHILVTTASQQSLDERALASGERVRCPYCAEIIRREAKVCPHCQRDLGGHRSSEPEPPRLDVRRE